MRLIKKKGTELYVATEIDSSGMSAYLVRDTNYADTWSSQEDAERFVVRLKERYPQDEFEVCE